MKNRIQARINDETKLLAQQMAESQGRTLNHACRELTEQLAEKQRQVMSHEYWLTEQVNQAFEKLDTNQSNFLDNHNAQSRMAERKAKIRTKATV